MFALVEGLRAGLQRCSGRCNIVHEQDVQRFGVCSQPDRGALVASLPSSASLAPTARRKEIDRGHDAALPRDGREGASYPVGNGSRNERVRPIS